MQFRTKLFTLLLGAALSACEVTPTQHPDPTGTASVQQPIDTATLGDVEPLDATQVGSFASWVAERNYDTWFLVMSFWKPSFALVIRQVEPERATASPTYALDLYVAKQSAHDARKTPPIGEWERKTITIESRAAGALNIASQATVRRARYPKPNIKIDEHGNRIETVTGTADGVAYYFGTFRFKGYTNTPRGGFSKDLATLAHRLKDVVDAPEDQRASLLGSCVEFADDLRTRVEAAPW